MNNENKNYQITVDCHGGERTFQSNGANLGRALQNLLDECVTNDDTGVFFELENADVEYFNSKPGFYVVGDYGILVKNIQPAE